MVNERSPDPLVDTSGNKQYAHIYLYHLSKAFYKYLQSYRAAQDASGSLFSEPINISSNVQGGYVIFTILNPHKEEIVL